MAEAFVYDHIRTPRGKGKKVGSLHEVKPVDLVVGLLDEIRTRNPAPRPAPHRRRRPRRGLADRRPGRRHRQDRRARRRPARHRRRRPAQPLLRLRPRGRQPGRARVRSGFEDLILAGGVESMSRVADGLRRRRLGDGPGDRARHRLRPAGHRRRPDRHPRGLVPRRRRRVRRRVAPPGREGLGQRLLRRLRRPGQGPQRPDRPRPRRADPPRHHRRVRWPASSRASPRSARDAGFDDVALEKYHWVDEIDHVHHAGNSSGIVDGAALVADRHRAGRHRTSA